MTVIGEDLSAAALAPDGRDAAIELNNEAILLERQGDFAGAESKHLQAIRIKEATRGVDSITTAVSYNGLGELYATIGNLDNAEEYLIKAVSVRERFGLKSDLAVTRDNLGRVFEMRGDLNAAEEIRRRGAPSNVACGNFQCPKISNAISILSKCTTCKAIFYCSRPCQVADWKRHKKYCKTRS
ncbi:uncharacterized protein BXZ73DRAFT_87274 [Epithele typhae]|uniref:uncharacterized protein n=1 Tax=Epithele typhae TaxID=378194 RepID=UPI002008A07F|nr:uncharacterized protein BXZ73DRAFT_87274 [Epithele typhae]KAH9944360.1 hypothetical protein BXZ73DRAFT_87274 [Epithele typhae]